MFVRWQSLRATPVASQRQSRKSRRGENVRKTTGQPREGPACEEVSERVGVVAPSDQRILLFARARDTRRTRSGERGRLSPRRECAFGYLD
jgi:hypothetical protein